MAYYSYETQPQELGAYRTQGDQSMLDTLPTELLMEILSHLTAEVSSSSIPSATSSLASTSDRMYDASRSYRIHNLNTRLAQISNLHTLFYIWPPPTFFRQLSQSRSEWQTSGGHIGTPADLSDIVCDDTCYNMIDSYITTLETINYQAYSLASYLCPLVQIDGFDDYEVTSKHAQILHCVLHLWRAQEYYAHDVDKIWRGDGGGDVITREATYGFAAGLDSVTVQGMRAIYGKLEEMIALPFSGEGEWLFRFIVREGMGAVWGRLGG